jgi:DNA-binding NtrC family response regulator
MLARLLIVDDNEELLENLADIVTAAGYGVLTASHPLDAIRLASHHVFDVALLDYRLPEMDGIELHSRLQRLRPSASYLLMTAYVDRKLQRAVTEGRFTAFFEKPVPIERVLELLD